MRSEDPLLLALKVLHQPKWILIRDGTAEFPSQLSFYPAQEVELGVVGLIDPIAGRLRHLVLVERRDELGGHEYHRLGLDRRLRDAAEPRSDQGQIAESGDASRGRRGLDLDQAGNCQRLSFSQLDDGAGTPFGDPRNRTTRRKGEPVDVVEFADDRFDVKAD